MIAAQAAETAELIIFGIPRDSAIFIARFSVRFAMEYVGGPHHALDDQNSTFHAIDNHLPTHQAPTHITSKSSFILPPSSFQPADHFPKGSTSQAREMPQRTSEQ